MFHSLDIRELESCLWQMANMTFCHMTKFSIHLSLTIKKLGSFTFIFILKKLFETVLICSFSILRNSQHGQVFRFPFAIIGLNV